jgi:hypothetical protein
LDKDINEFEEAVHEHENGRYYPGAKHDASMIERLKENILRFTGLRKWLQKEYDA